MRRKRAKPARQEGPSWGRGRFKDMDDDHDKEG